MSQRSSFILLWCFKSNHPGCFRAGNDMAAENYVQIEKESEQKEDMIVMTWIKLMFRRLGCWWKKIATKTSLSCSITTFLDALRRQRWGWLSENVDYKIHENTNTNTAILTKLFRIGSSSTWIFHSTVFWEPPFYSLIYKIWWFYGLVLNKCLYNNI